MSHSRYIVKINLLFLLSLFIANPILAQQDTLRSSDYTKAQYDIAMRDGVKLHTVVYAPEDK
ncbi:MAG: hypothetical protein R3222_10635 [Balneolaceae bacterium]|nr:hypothetical protein [Balneolaceae bacterium]